VHHSEFVDDSQKKTELKRTANWCKHKIYH